MCGLEERLLNDFRSYETGITRSGRSRRPVSYIFDEYDLVIDEALEITKKRKTEQRNEKKHIKQEKFLSDGDSDTGANLKDSHMENSDSDMGTDLKDENIKNGESSDSESQIQQNNTDMVMMIMTAKVVIMIMAMNLAILVRKRTYFVTGTVQKAYRSQCSKRLAGVMNHPVMETSNLATKNRLRQRPTCNSTLDSIVPDSEDEKLSENTKGETSEGEVLSPEANSEESIDG
ncbi:hypothetical protein GH714_032809 [Hevea brasiliensis]|uniref:Uncharacterized protein n=1 Tax=Hevea brasiliensis TaxID=3981 RepID=A0A6A6LSR9_HEVBR|nr:hypothetical protein GH714_032809 [Hevea brasiliensis]